MAEDYKERIKLMALDEETFVRLTMRGKLRARDVLWRQVIVRPVLIKNERHLQLAPAPTPDLQRWAAFCAAMVEWLCWQDGLSFPEWTNQESYDLQEPWFLYKGWRLRAWQLATTPAPFKRRKIFGGDRMLDRV